MKALVTGNLGFIGGALTDDLIAKNIEVIGVDKNKKSQEPKDRLAITKFIDTASKKDTEQFKKEELDYIFHFGSPCSNLQFMKNPAALNETVAGMLNIFEIAKVTNAKVVYPSSCTVYAGELPQVETNILPKPTTLYSVGKLACENMAYYYERTFGVKSTGVRIFVAYGDREEYKGDVASAVTQFLIPMENGKRPVIWGDGTQYRDAVHIKDVSSLILRLAFDSNSPKIMNIGTGNATSFNDIVSMINEKLGTKIAPTYITKPNWYTGNNKADMSLAKKLYNFNARTLDEGLDEYIAYRKQKGL
jgi:nucleoside-diphosphate-sugar epimerase